MHFPVKPQKQLTCGLQSDWTLCSGNIEVPWKRGKQIYDYSLQQFMTIQLSSVAQSCPTLYDPMVCSTPGFPVHHQLPELTQTHVHC